MTSAIATLIDVCRHNVNVLALGEIRRHHSNIGTTKGGTRASVIPAAAEADLQFRLVTPAAPVKEMLERAVGDRTLVEYLSVAEPQQMLAVAGFETCVVRFATDIPHLTNWGTPLLIGPGSFSTRLRHERLAKRERTEAVVYIQHLSHAGGIDFRR